VRIVLQIYKIGILNSFNKIVEVFKSIDQRVKWR
jgi:hypothetical protein